LKAPGWSQHLNLKCDFLVSSLCFLEMQLVPLHLAPPTTAPRSSTASPCWRRSSPVGRCTLTPPDPYLTQAPGFKPITYNLSSEKPGFKVCLSNATFAATLRASALVDLVPEHPQPRQGRRRWRRRELRARARHVADDAGVRVHSHGGGRYKPNPVALPNPPTA
jgi:hypothetical protein